MSAVAWYEFSRGPRTRDHLALARCLFGAGGIVQLSEQLAAPAAGAADVAIGVTASGFG